MKKTIAFVLVRLIITTSLSTSVASADDAKPTENVINNCVNITMSVKGCGDDRLAPCESSFCYQTYDFKLSEIKMLPVSDSLAPTAGLKKEHKKKHRHPSSSA